jgi:ribosomal protein L37AE/L43A
VRLTSVVSHCNSQIIIAWPSSCCISSILWAQQQENVNNNAEGGIAVTMITSIRHPSQAVTCAKCGDVLTIPDWIEFFEEERRILNLWSCTQCGYRFETEAIMPADAKSMGDTEAMEAFFPSLLVA